MTQSRVRIGQAVRLTQSASQLRQRVNSVKLRANGSFGSAEARVRETGRLDATRLNSAYSGSTRSDRVNSVKVSRSTQLTRSTRLTR
ncbi:hypothetical protein Hanom_Chr04g00341151 [Helianthus anomalus]